MSVLKLAPGLALPLEVVTQSLAILAKRRAGKSYTARRIVEQLFKAHAQVVIVDPKGDWWGIRSSADGKSAGLPIIILGGERGDAPLEVQSGELVAKLAVEEQISLLLDLSLFRKHEVATFMTAFLEAFYRLKARDQFRTPVMLAIDEADAIAPQRPMKGEERMLGAAEDIVRRGGQRGIGCLLISQRSAVINKNVLTQVQVLVALRTIAPQDLDALSAWIDVHGTQEQRKVLMDSLPSLPVGDAWFWSPGWPTVDGTFKRVHIHPIETFDSGATPKPGEKRIQPKNLADVDLESLRKQMAATLERAKADNPKELRKTIAERDKWIKHLEHLLQTAKPTAPDPAKEQAARREAARAVHKTYAPAIRDLEDAFRLLKSAADFQDAITEEPPPPIRQVEPPRHFTQRAAPQRHSAPNNGDAGQVSEGGKRRMLTALAQCPGGLKASQLGIRATLSSKGGTFTKYLGQMRSAGWIEGERGKLKITNSGLLALGDYDPLPTGPELLEYWLRELGDTGMSRMLRALATAGGPCTAEELGEKSGVEANGGTFTKYLGKLRTLELVTGGRNDLRASEDLF